jgi:hypothetical protein
MMERSSNLPNMQDVGIVTLHQALLDDALEAAEAARQIGIKPGSKEVKERYWCTLCSQFLSRRSAYSHRQKHSQEVQMQLPTNLNALLELKRTLNGKYGAKSLACRA